MAEKAPRKLGRPVVLQTVCGRQYVDVLECTLVVKNTVTFLRSFAQKFITLLLAKSALCRVHNTHSSARSRSIRRAHVPKHDAHVLIRPQSTGDAQWAAASLRPRSPKVLRRQSAQTEEASQKRDN